MIGRLNHVAIAVPDLAAAAAAPEDEGQGRQCEGQAGQEGGAHRCLPESAPGGGLAPRIVPALCLIGNLLPMFRAWKACRSP